MGLTVVDSLDIVAWRQFVDRHPQANIFHTPEMFQVFAQATGHRPMLEAVVGDEGEVLALLLPVQVTLRDGLFRRLTTRSIAYGSVLCAPDSVGLEALALLLRTYTRDAGHAALFSELRNLSDLSAIQPVLNECGFAYEEHLDYLIDLNCSPEQVLQNIGPRTRKHIRRALRKGNVTVEQVTNRNQIIDWYDLVRKTYEAARVYLADRSLFEAAFDILHPRGMIRFWLARIGTTYAAASAELVYKDVVYGWYGGMDRAYAEDLPGELLMWHILEWGAEAKYKTYDFGGAGKPGEAYGVRDFKAKFGGRLVCFGRNIYIHAPGLLRLSTLGYRILTSRFIPGQRFLAR
jgi:lipid II:glycine glycyltransferase (peptidoglycan interpeptide bridge formation enzyme)